MLGITADAKGFLIFREAKAGESVNASGFIVASNGNLAAVRASTHNESLTDGAGNLIFAGGDVIVCIGVPD